MEQHTAEWKLGYAVAALKNILQVIDERYEPNRGAADLVTRIYGIAERAVEKSK